MAADILTDINLRLNSLRDHVIEPRRKKLQEWASTNIMPYRKMFHTLNDENKARLKKNMNTYTGKMAEVKDLEDLREVTLNVVSLYKLELNRTKKYREGFIPKKDVEEFLDKLVKTKVIEEGIRVPSETIGVVRTKVLYKLYLEFKAKLDNDDFDKW